MLNTNNSAPTEVTGRDAANSVVNLSSRTLNTDELSVLNKGITFCQTPGEPDLAHFRDDLDSFHLQLKESCFSTQN